MDRSHDEHEALCRRCGISCHFAVPVNGLPIVVDDLHCTFLGRSDDGRFACTVYEKRFEVAPWCATSDEALEQGLLAQDCPYAAGVRGYRGKTRLHPRLLTPALPMIRADLLTNGAPRGLSLDGLRRFLARTGGGDFTFVEDAAGRIRITLTVPADENGAQDTDVVRS